MIPPPVVKPGDEGEYWSKKWLYIKQNYDPKTAVEKMKEAFEKSGAFAEVSWGDDRYTVILTDTEGRKTPMNYRQPGRRRLRDMCKDELLALHEGYKEHYEQMLKADILLLSLGGSEMIVGGKKALDVVHILLGEGKPKEKVKQLESLKVLKRGLDTFHSLVYKFEASEQLKERVEKREKE